MNAKSIMHKQSLGEWFARVQTDARIRTALPPVDIAFENETDLSDAIAILAALEKYRGALRYYPTFNTWKINPLFGLDDDAIDALLASHYPIENEWVADDGKPVALTIAYVRSIKANVNRSAVPALAIGLQRMADHLCLLASLHTEERLRFHLAIDQKNRAVELSLLKRLRGGKQKLLFRAYVGDFPIGDNSYNRLCDATLRGGGIGLLTVPGTVQQHERVLSLDTYKMVSLTEWLRHPAKTLILDFDRGIAYTDPAALIRQFPAKDFEIVKAA